jgi:hypothetical protein
VTRRTTLCLTGPGAILLLTLLVAALLAPATVHAMDRPAIAETLGFSKITGSIILSTFDFYFFLNGVGPRVEESGLGLIAGHAYSAPYEDVRVRK